MRKRLPIILSTAALVIAVFGSTPVGRAAIDAAVPLARRSFLADTAKNALQVNKIKASRTPTPGMLLPLDATGKLPASVGAVGAKGDSGAKGDKGDPGTPGTPGLSEVELVSAANVNNTATGLKTVTVSCPAGKKVIGGGAEIQSSPIYPIEVRVRDTAGNVSERAATLKIA
jgi:hypothetical protein